MTSRITSPFVDLFRRFGLQSTVYSKDFEVIPMDPKLDAAAFYQTDEKEVMVKNDDQKVILRSTEGKMFPVDCRHLVAASSIFASMMEAAHPGENPTDIDANDFDLLYFLGMILGKPFAMFLPFPTIDTILNLGDMYECPIITKDIIPHLAKHVISRPWTVFRYAANLQNPGLAKLSLKNMWREQPGLRTLKTKRITAKLVDGIPTEYLTALIRAIGSMPKSEWETRDKGRARWLKISAAFKVK